MTEVYARFPLMLVTLKAKYSSAHNSLRAKNLFLQRYFSCNAISKLGVNGTFWKKYHRSDSIQGTNYIATQD